MPRSSLILLALLAGCGAVSTPKADAPPSQEQAPAQRAPSPTGQFDTSHAGTPAPALELETAPDGSTETIAAILAKNPGKPLLVNLWATWCAPCIRELHTLDALAGETGMIVVPVSQDMEGWRAVTPAWHKLGMQHLATRLELKMQFGLALKAAGLPLSVLYGADGREIWRYAGDRDWNDAESRAKLGVTASR